MKRVIVSTLLLIWIFILPYGTSGQGKNISVKFRTLSVLPAGSVNSPIYQLKIDNAAHLVVEPGIVLSYSHFIRYDKIALKIEEGFYADPASMAAAYTHVGLRFRFAKKTSLAKKNKHTLHIGAGLSFYYRSSWEEITGYIYEEGVSSKGGMQYFFFRGPAVEVEYDRYLSKKADFSASLNFGYPYGINIGLGFKFWLSRKFKNDCGC